MKWKFWEEEVVIETKKEEPKVGSFLFATDMNGLHIISIERGRESTHVLFRKSSDGFTVDSQKRYDLTLSQHEEFIIEISKNIACIVVPQNKDNK